MTGQADMPSKTAPVARTGETPNQSMANFLAAAEPDGPRPLDGLVARLNDSGQLKSAPAIGAMVEISGVTFDSRDVGQGFTSLPSRALIPTDTTSSPGPQVWGPRWRSWSGRSPASRFHR